MTEKLYYQDAGLLTFTARVLDCREAPGGWAVTLSRPAFIPRAAASPRTGAPWGGAPCWTSRNGETP